MRIKMLILAILSFGIVFYLTNFNLVNAAGLADRMSGRILLQVEEKGEAWYVNPVNKQRYYIKDGTRAYSILRDLGVGISNFDINKIPVGIEDRFKDIDSDGDGLADKLEEGINTDPKKADSDGDGYSDGIEVHNGYNPLGGGRLKYDYNLANRLKGRILLQVESRGEAWYVNPDDGKRYYMKDGEAAYQIMRFLSLGITNKNLEQIEVDSSSLGFDEMLKDLPVVNSGGIDFYKIGKPYYDTASDPFVVGGTLGFFATNDEKKVMVYDGTEYGTQYYKVSNPTDINGKLAYVATEDQRIRQHYLYYDGEIIDLPKNYWGPAELYSVGGKPAYVIRLKDGTDVVVVNGKEIGRYNSVIPAAALDRDNIVDIGGKAAFIERKKVGDRQWDDIVYFDGRKVAQYPEIRNVISAGDKLAFMVQEERSFNNTKWRPYFNGGFVGNNIYVRGDLVDFNGKLAFISQDNRIIIDGKPVTSYLNNPKNLFVYNGELAYIDSGDNLFVGDSEVGAEYDEIKEAKVVGGRLYYKATIVGQTYYVFDGQEYQLPYSGQTINVNIELSEVVDRVRPVYVVWQDKNKSTIFDKRGLFIYGDNEPRCGWFDEIIDIDFDEAGTIYFLARNSDDVKVYNENCSIKFVGPKPWPSGRRSSNLKLIGGKIVVQVSGKIMYIDGVTYEVKGDFYSDIEQPVEIGGKVGFIFVDSEEGYEKSFIVYEGKEYGKEYANAFNPFSLNGELGFIAWDEYNSRTVYPENSFIILSGEKIGQKYDYVSGPLEVNGKLAFIAHEKQGGWISKSFIVYNNQEFYRDRDYLQIGELKNVEGKLAFMAEIRERDYDRMIQDKYILVYDGQEIGRDLEPGVRGYYNLDGEIAYSTYIETETGLGPYPCYYIVHGDKQYGKCNVGYFEQASEAITVDGKIAYHILGSNPYASNDPDEYIIYDGKKIADEYGYNDSLINVNGKLAFVVKEKFDKMILLEK